MSYGVVSHNEKLLWQHEVAPADQGLAAGAPLTTPAGAFVRLQAAVWTASAEPANQFMQVVTAVPLGVRVDVKEWRVG